MKFNINSQNYRLFVSKLLLEHISNEITNDISSVCVIPKIYKEDGEKGLQFMPCIRTGNDAQLYTSSKRPSDEFELMEVELHEDYDDEIEVTHRLPMIPIKALLESSALFKDGEALTISLSDGEVKFECPTHYMTAKYIPTHQLKFASAFV
jgi:hypothetical protein